MKGAKTQKTPKELKAWEKEKKLIPVMIKKYCHGKHGTKGEEVLFLLQDPLLQAGYAGEDKGRDEVVGAENDIHASRVRIQARFSDDKLQTQIKKRGKSESKCLIGNF